MLGCRREGGGLRRAEGDPRGLHAVRHRRASVHADRSAQPVHPRAELALHAAVRETVGKALLAQTTETKAVYRRVVRDLPCAERAIVEAQRVDSIAECQRVILVRVVHSPANPRVRMRAAIPIHLGAIDGPVSWHSPVQIERLALRRTPIQRVDDRHCQFVGLSRHVPLETVVVEEELPLVFRLIAKSQRLVLTEENRIDPSRRRRVRNSAFDRQHVGVRHEVRRTHAGRFFPQARLRKGRRAGQPDEVAALSRQVNPAVGGRIVDSLARVLESVPTADKAVRHVGDFRIVGVALEGRLVGASATGSDDDHRRRGRSFDDAREVAGPARELPARQRDRAQGNRKHVMRERELHLRRRVRRRVDVVDRHHAACSRRGGQRALVVGRHEFGRRAEEPNLVDHRVPPDFCLREHAAVQTNRVDRVTCRRPVAAGVVTAAPAEMHRRRILRLAPVVCFLAPLRLRAVLVVAGRGRGRTVRNGQRFLRRLLGRLPAKLLEVEETFAIPASVVAERCRLVLRNEQRVHPARLRRAGDDHLDREHVRPRGGGHVRRHDALGVLLEAVGREGRDAGEQREVARLSRQVGPVVRGGIVQPRAGVLDAVPLSDEPVLRVARRRQRIRRRRNDYRPCDGERQGADRLTPEKTSQLHFHNCSSPL